ncbi:MAG: cytidylate kinase-like family protein [Lachnospiraceae bacterium]|nr:cytidylate kinase-like family protein [Lachnospiraceae bacterium]MDD3617515.1 cytidylate kinase-like family protein [Lachnospiraceae bacterium]
MSRKIITINRTYGSNGRLIGKALAEELGIHYYDKELLKITSEQNDIPYEELLKVDEKRASPWRYPVNDPYQMNPQFRFDPFNDVLFRTQSEVIESLANKEDCVIIGRCANQILGDRCISVFIHAPYEERVKTVMARLDRTEKSARAMIKKVDKDRRSYYEYFTDEKWLDMSQYNLCIDSSRFSQDEIVRMLAAMFREDQYIQ